MPEKLVRCTKEVKSSLSKKHPNWTPEKVDSTARAICVKQTGLKFNKKDSVEINKRIKSYCESTGIVLNEDGSFRDIGFEYLVDEPQFQFEEKVSPDTEKPTGIMIIKGRALYPATSRNYTRYTADEIQKSAKFLKGVPFQKDHSDSVKDTFGVITKSTFDKSTGDLLYEAEVDANDPVTQAIQKGFIKSVSVKLRAKSVTCSIDGEPMTFWHRHMPGFEYEREDSKGQPIRGSKKLLAEAIPKDWYYFHLAAVTAPGMPRANINMSAESDSESELGFMSDTLNEIYLEGINQIYSPLYGITLSESIGENYMPDDDKTKEEWKKALDAQLQSERTALENEKLKTQLEEQQKRQQELQEQIEEMKNQQALKEKENFVDELITLQVKAKRLTKENSSAEKEKLMKESVDLVKGRLDIYREWNANNSQQNTRSSGISPSFSNSKSRVFDVPPEQGDNPQIPINHEMTQREQMEARIEFYGRQMFGKNWNQSWEAVQMYDRWNYQTEKWRDPLRDALLESVGRPSGGR